VGEVDAAKGVIDVVLADGGVGGDEGLVGGETHEVEALRKRAALEGLEVVVGLRRHLLVEDLDAVEAHVGRLVDAGRDLGAVALEVPEGISGDADAQGVHGGRMITGRAWNRRAEGWNRR